MAKKNRPHDLPKQEDNGASPVAEESTSTIADESEIVIEGEAKPLEEKADDLLLEKASTKPSKEQALSTEMPANAGASKFMWALMWVLLAAVAWIGWSTKNSDDSLKNDLDAIDAKMGEERDAHVQAINEKIGQDFNTLHSRLSNLEKTDSTWKNQIQTQLQHIAQTQESWNTQREHFLQLQENSALIGVFQRIIAAEQALPTHPALSERLLQSVRARLKRQNDAQSQKLLPLVEEDLAHLEQQKNAPNVAAMFKELANLSQESASWPLKHTKDEKKLSQTVERAKEYPQAAEVSVNSFSTWIEESLADIWRILSDFVRVQSLTEADVLATATPSWLVYENMRLRFLGLSLALSSPNENIFETELAQTLSAIDRNFDLTDSHVRHAQQILRSMQNTHSGRMQNLKSSAYLLAVPAEVLP